MARSDKKKAKKKGFWRRFLRFWLYTVVIIFGLILLLGLAVYLFLPPHYIRDAAVTVVRQQLDRELEIESVRLNLFRGFEFSNISLQTPDSLANVPDDFPVQSAIMKSAVLKYDFWPLLKRRVIVREIILDAPAIVMNIPPADKKTAETPPDTTQKAQPVLPVSINLEKLRLQDAAFALTTGDADQQFSIRLSNININLDQITVPQGNIVTQDSSLRGNLELAIDRGELWLESVSGGNRFALTADIDLENHTEMLTLDTLNLDLDLVLRNTALQSSALKDMPSFRLQEPLALHLEGHYYPVEERVHVPDLTLRVGNETWLGLHGFMNGLSARQPYLAVNVERGHIPVSQALNVARPFLPDSLLERIYFQNKDAAVTFTGTELKGYLPDSLSGKGLSYTAVADFLQFGMTADYGQVELLDLNVSVRSTGRMRYSGLEQLEAFVNVSFDSLFYGLSDTFNVYSGPGNLELQAGLNELMVPEIVNMDLDVENVVGTHLNGSFILTGTNSLKTLSGNGRFTCTNLDTDNFPQIPFQTKGTLGMVLSINTLDSIYNRIELYTDSLIVPNVIMDETFPSLRLVNKVYFKVDTTFQDFVFDSIRLELNNNVDAFVTGDVKGGGKKSFSFNIIDIGLTHGDLKSWLPSRRREQYRSLEFTGSTHITGSVNGSLRDGIPHYVLEARLFTKDLDVIYPEQFIQLKEIGLDVNTVFTSENTLSADLELTIDSTFTDKFSGSAYLNNRTSCRVSSPDLQFLEISGGRLQLPDMNASGDFYVNIREMQNNPTISAFVNFHQDAPSYKAVARDLSMRGTTDLQAVVNMDTSLLDVYVTLKTENLYLLLPAETQLDNINADIKVHQRMDLVNGIFMQDEASEISTPSQGSIDYMSFRDYYRNSLNDMSDLKIERVQAAGYELHNFSLEAVLGNGRIEIPSFSSTIYEGSLGGRLSVNLAGGDLTQARYTLSAHFSDINSDRLLPGLRRKETLGEINGNARFTGIGLDPNQQLDIGGYFYITEIGPQVADNLLRSLDPEEKDSGIKMTRTLINRGYKPKLFSFNLSHGFFATTVELSQPWYYPLKLSGSKISLSRQPVQFFIDMALANAQAVYE